MLLASGFAYAPLNEVLWDIVYFTDISIVSFKEKAISKEMERHYLRPKKRMAPNNRGDRERKFPEVPDGYDPKGENREIFPGEFQEKHLVITIDGFQIKNEIDEDFCSGESVSSAASYKDKGGSCEICKKSFDIIDEAVIHIHERHGIVGGSEHVMVNADMLMKAGYLSICVSNIKSIHSSGNKSNEKDETFSNV